ncbi:sodium-coupled monocarboxylate transporter 1 isoform X2 [Uranotaenia lowii]|uniref:sodium-coupled monocarboxylate transporter 1 isoform X2 n=1 Tax=Uranotaenia lowii TaxID=190385 RepID=UPI00247AE8DD|nr:sodium-coupled monocarboxylate transporter 1 isoform X2 [Uranotaenia lowii]XP_055590125.1 sodium-coupled monocarboxylate transporter 1 isoform X2 [Uranotaenia lowii]
MMSRGFTDLLWDYAVFIAFIVFSTLYPLWSRFFGKKEKTKADYVFGLGNISMVAMMLSIARGTLGVRSVLGYPSELFYRGTAMWETLYGMVTAYPIVCFVFIPVYFNLGVTSVYQYLDLRFNSRLVRCLASATYIVRAILNQGVTVFTPTVALTTVIGIPYWVSLVAISVISIIFNLLGGLKAAITADVIQTVTMILISIGIIIQSMVNVGGFEKIFTIPAENGRLNFFNFTGDMTVRVDTTSAWLGQLFMSMSIFGCQQNFVQRYLSMSTFKEVRRTLMSNIPMVIGLFSLAWIVGLGVYSVYADCDPMSAGYTNRMDEILPFFMEDKFSYLPGVLGLFMASLFNGALSLNVSNLNSLATVTWEDFLAPLPRFKGITDKQQLTIIKFIGSVYGVAIMGVGFAVGLLSGVIESSLLMTSATSGPLLGVFILAMLVPVANWKGAAAGVIISHIITLWITFGSLMVNKETVLLPTSIEGCTNETFSAGITKPSRSWLLANTPLEIESDFSYLETPREPQLTETESQFPESLYAVSYMYYSLIGTFITVVVGTLVSYLTHHSDDAYDHKLLHPAVYRLSKMLPGKERRYVPNPSIKPKIPSDDQCKVPIDKLEQDNAAFDGKNEGLEEKQPSADVFVVNLTNDLKKAESDRTAINSSRSPNELYRKLDEELTDVRT